MTEQIECSSYMACLRGIIPSVRKYLFHRIFTKHRQQTFETNVLQVDTFIAIGHNFFSVLKLVLNTVSKIYIHNV